MTRIARLLAVSLVAGCVGEIGEPSGTAPPLGQSGGSAGGSGVGVGGGAVGGTGGTAPDPFAVAPTCTSGTMWTQGDHGSDDMNPGRACITCHNMGDGPYA